jgi:disease resistance protein RPM1
MEGAAQTIFSNVGQLLAEEYRQLSGVGGEVLELRDDLATMNALIRMQSEAEDGAVDHFVREWMKQLRELAYDAEDCIDHYKLRIRARPGDGVRARLERLLGTLLPRRRLAREIGALRARAVAISERHARYGVSRDALRRSPTLLPAAPVAAPASAPAPANDADRHLFVGFGFAYQAATLAARVMKARAGEKGDLKAVFSVVGFGGLGKTTLAMEVCRQLKAEFQRQAMVSVSQAFEPIRDLKPLLKRILQQVAKTRNDDEGALDDIDRLDDNELAAKLEESLKESRYAQLPSFNCPKYMIFFSVDRSRNKNLFVHQLVTEGVFGEKYS